MGRPLQCARTVARCIRSSGWMRIETMSTFVYSQNQMEAGCIRSSGWMRIETDMVGGKRIWEHWLHPVFGLDED